MTKCLSCSAGVDFEDKPGQPNVTCPSCGAVYVDRDSAEGMVKRYVCAGCYGHLLTQFDGHVQHLTMVYCPSCGAGRGFVTKSHADRKRAESKAEAWEVAANLGDALGIVPEAKSEDELLKGLGF